MPEAAPQSFSPPTLRSSAHILRSLALFTQLDDATVAQIAQEAEWVPLAADATLFRAGDPGDSMYVLAAGRLDVCADAPGGGDSVIARVTPGKPVGEMALFDNAKRSATVRAARDSVLLRISQASFERLSEQNPAILREVGRVLVERLRQGAAVRAPPAANPVLAVVAASERAPLERFCAVLTAALAPPGRALRVDAAMAAAARLSAQWLDQLESNHDYLVLQADPEDSRWTELCIRQADVVVLLADANDPPGAHRLAGRLSGRRLGSFDRRELVLVQPDNAALPRHTCRWLDAVNVDAHHHVRFGRAADVRRVARLLTGRGVALALSGGASRGFAHIGVIRALYDAGVPIDVVCGTSMGSIIAAQCALGWDPSRMRDEGHRGLVVSSPFDFTLPLLSATRGQKFERMLDEFFGDADLEDLWLRCVPVSCSLGRAEVNVHREGRVTHAVRCSCALPGLLPPVNVDGDLLVDGVFLANLPADIAQRECGGRTIAVNVIPAMGASSWAPIAGAGGLVRQVGQLLNPFARGPKLPILDLMMQGFFLGTLNASARAREVVDLYIEPATGDFWFLDFAVLDAAIDAGYEAARRGVAEWRRRAPDAVWA